ncbi:cysteine peptidase family C39 domain-containing protein [Saccharibacillus sp. CPCC 101409]|uniref:cysteine peptidase family C39 domain-containing protein n=1 Tax=Saccharibacillus sp. CPCC 101409 TaxID=3058041 RepID=UPI0026737DAD|nr:cysteine peptidase family C39 domain-containing protein [Saccharibacillus sp. CPCC 101409]MDO3410546.1 cysteine peptidase family C39 domain-containing protein [Saccharibacillus sp. CPCC 101409]
MKSNISLLVTGAAVAVVAANYRAFPKKDPISTDGLPESYLIEAAGNRTDFQTNKECAAFSSAYVLRHLGVEADGNALYRKYPRKLLDGTVDPKGILVFFRQQGIEADFYRGTVETLKMRISLGTPVIAFIKVHANKRYAHFSPIIGYHRDHFYLAESLEHKANDQGGMEKGYNRKLPIAELESLWRTNPFYRQSYIVVSP